MKIIDNNILTLNEWIAKYKNTIFRMLEYKKVWTPYEMENKFIDSSEYKDDHYTLVKICEAVNLPNGEILLKLIDVPDDDYEREDNIYYWRNMKDIVLEQFDSDIYEDKEDINE